jgi:hypothetical protein
VGDAREQWLFLMWRGLGSCRSTTDYTRVARILRVFAAF